VPGLAGVPRPGDDPGMRIRTLSLLLTLTTMVSCSDDRGLGSQPPVDPSDPVGRIAAKVTGVRNAKGRLLVRLYRGGEGFPSNAEAAYRTETFAVVKGTTNIAFENVPHGEYALWICHDEDADGNLKSNFLGMPTEGVGVSGPPPSFIPGYDGARFTLDSELSEHDIPLRYL